MRVLSVPHFRALSAQFDSGSKHALCGLPKTVSRGLCLSRTIGELRPLRWVVREEHFGVALSHLLNRGRESTRVCSACLLAERPGDGQERECPVNFFHLSRPK
jgi:hypothetical protein